MDAVSARIVFLVTGNNSLRGAPSGAEVNSRSLRLSKVGLVGGVSAAMDSVPSLRALEGAGYPLR
jgi:hypothetical protein